MFFLKAACSLLLVVANVTIGKSNERFFAYYFVISEKISIFAPWFWKESPVKVHLAVLNWECEWESPTVPQQWTPLWLLSINAIELLSEKALGSGGKSEDQPLSERMPLHHDVWCNLAQVNFCGRTSFLTHWESYVYYYISLQGQPVVRQICSFLIE